MSWWYTADFTLFQPNWFKAPPFQDTQDYNSRSAITFVQNIHTPTMFVLGEADYRTPPDSGGEQLFRALKFLKRPTAMVIFPRETHELSRSGEPWHRIERLDHIVGWLDKWLMGVPHPEYDIRPEKQDRKSTTSELQSRLHLVCRLLLEKKKKTKSSHTTYPKLHTRYHNQTPSSI